MFRKIDYICLWIRPVLNSFWNCFSYSDKGCITPCINFITCFIWCCFWPPSTVATFPVFYSFCVDSTAVFWGDDFDGGYGSTCRLVEIYVTTEFYLFSLIQFLSLEFQFHFEMSHYCFFVCFAAGTSVVCFYSYYGYDWRLKNAIIMFVLCKILFAEFTSKIDIFSSF